MDGRVNETHLLAGRQVYETPPLGELARRYVLIGAEKLKAYRIKPVTPKLKLNLGFGMEFLEGAADLEIEGQAFSLMDVLAQHRKNSYVTLNDGTQAVNFSGSLIPRCSAPNSISTGTMPSRSISSMTRKPRANCAGRSIARRKRPGRRA